MRLVLSLVVLAAAVSCSSLDVRVDRDEAYVLAGKRSYSWVAGVDASNELNQKRIDRGVDAALAGLGYALGETATDLLVRTEVATQRELRSSGGNVGVSYGGSRSRVTASTADRVYEVTVGSLVIEVLDGASAEVVWRAVALDTLSKDPQRTEESIALAIEQAFAQFPPAVASAAPAGG